MKRRNPSDHPEFDFERSERRDGDWDPDSNGARRRDEGIERVLKNTPKDYQILEGMAFWFLVDTLEPFTPEHARPLCGNPPNNPNAFSAIWSWLKRKAEKRGMIKHLGWTKTTRKTSNRRDLPIYIGIKPPRPGVKVSISF